jgi:hypothetical protein
LPGVVQSSQANSGDEQGCPVAKIDINLEGSSSKQAVVFLVDMLPNGGAEEAACIACTDGPISFVNDIIEELGLESQPEMYDTDLVGGIIANLCTELYAEIEQAETPEEKEAVVNRYLHS